jgi:hypothetical protein
MTKEWWRDSSEPANSGDAKKGEGVAGLDDASIDNLITEEFHWKMHSPLSKNLPVNQAEHTDPTGREYAKMLPEYSMPAAELYAYEAAHPDELKTEFREANPNIGWKFHLNVLQENVRIVSEYLRKNGYNHKYLKGGEPSDGKIFTVYVGSHRLTQQLARKVSNDLQGKLAKPATTSDEIEIATGVIGRFSGSGKRFNQYGTCGFTLLKEDMNHINSMTTLGNESELIKEYERLVLTKEWHKAWLLEQNDRTGAVKKYHDFKNAAEMRAFKALVKEYGDYFFTQPAAKSS